MSGRAATTGIIPGRFGLSVGRPDIEPPEGWRWTKLTDVARLETGHTPSRRKPAYWDGDIPWIGIKDARLYHGRVIPDTIQHTTPLGIENSAARVLPAETVCLSRTASIGYVTMMGQPMATSQDFVNWVCSDKLDPKFLMSLLIAESDSLNYFSHGSTHQTIYFPEVKAFHVCLPSIDEQRRIAAVLGALDDRIEVNRRMNRTLEAMAQALFRRRFVDFDGRDDLVEHEAGLIPEGWDVQPIGDVLELSYGKSLPKRKREPGTVPVYGSGGLTGSHTESLVDGPGVVVGRKGSIGTVYWEDADFFPIDTTFFVEPRAEGISLRWIYYRLLHMDLTRLGSDSAVPGLNRNAVYSQHWVIPPSQDVESFERIVRPLMAKMSANDSHSSTLAALRDALLPKLVSGDLRVSEALAESEA